MCYLLLAHKLLCDALLLHLRLPSDSLQRLQLWMLASFVLRPLSLCQMVMWSLMQLLGLCLSHHNRLLGAIHGCIAPKVLTCQVTLSYVKATSLM